MVINIANSIIAVVNLIASLLLANIAFAETKTFIKEYTYMASDIDSKVSSRAIALEQVKRALLEQLGTYLVSETDVKMYQLTKDQITTLTAGIVSAEVIEEKWDGRSYYLKAKIAADPSDVAKSVDTLRNDVQKTKELKDSKNKAEEAMREVEKLKKELRLVAGDTKRQGEYADAIKDLSAADWFDKGLSFQKSNNYKNAIAAYTNAIELKPQYVQAYNNRGLAEIDLGNYQQAIDDYNKAIELNPKEANAFNNRGNAYKDLGNNQQAINDYNKTLELSPEDEMAYYNRGNVYNALGNHQQAISDYNKALKLNPKDTEAYSNRGVAYNALGNHQRAINDYNKAIELNSNYAEAYYNRGLNYSKLGKHQRAITDCSKAIELNPLFSDAYYLRGLAYAMLDNKKMYIRNLKSAAKLGKKEAREDLNSQGIEWQ